jgi:hypothetical protein
VGSLWTALLSVSNGLAHNEKYKKGLLGVLGDLILGSAQSQPAAEPEDPLPLLTLRRARGRLEMAALHFRSISQKSAGDSWRGEGKSLICIASQSRLSLSCTAGLVLVHSWGHRVLV